MRPAEVMAPDVSTTAAGTTLQADTRATPWWKMHLQDIDGVHYELSENAVDSNRSKLVAIGRGKLHKFCSGHVLKFILHMAERHRCCRYRFLGAHAVDPADN